jgi:acetyl-CoA C-acetyltransferase
MAKEMQKDTNFEILGYLTEFTYAGVEPSRMGIGPVFAIHKLFSKTNLNFNDIDLIEINEAFSAQVLGCLKAFSSEKFCKENFNNTNIFDKIDIDTVNVNGGAIALGHPVGMSGSRIIIHLLRELRRRGKKRGLASICIGGGQGGACIVEVN